jgi:hypothetical protein
MQLYFARAEKKRLKIAKKEGLDVEAELEHIEDKVMRLEDSEFELLSGVR